ncbi:MAG: cobalt ECF transporter T component CbiQ, partial [Alphaproteobacteria bacterium]|nr:cobalt ECF transporter T component CbiQ [Alphaproteobacteria bacterium]
MSLAETNAAPGRAFVEMLDPRMRIICAFALCVLTVSLASFAAKVIAIFFSLILLAVSGMGWRKVARRLAHVEGFMLALLILLPFTVPGRSIAVLGPLPISAEGLHRGAHIVLSVNAAALAVLALAGSLEAVRMGRALSALGLPDKLVRLVMFVARYQGLFSAEIRRQMEAMRARGFAPAFRRHSFRAFGNLAGMILIASIERAERVDEAMRCRGYNGRFPLRRIRAITHMD